MSKWVNTLVLDGALDVIATADLMTACSAQPTTFAEATATYALADVAMAGGDYTKAAGTGTSARKVTMAQKTGVTVDATASATHVALTKAAGSVLIYITTCTSQALTSGNTMTFPAWSVEFGDPA